MILGDNLRGVIPLNIAVSVLLKFWIACPFVRFYRTLSTFYVLCK